MGETEKNFGKWIEKSIREDSIVSFDLDRLEIGEKLGTGGFGQVYKASLNVGVSPITVAVKKFRNSSDLEVDEKTQEDLVKEIRLLRSVGFHPNILDFHGISKDSKTETTYMLILEYADGGSLRDYLKNNNALSGNERLQLAKEIVSGVACLHDNDIIHRDLNSANILVNKNVIKIADLGLSKKAGATDNIQKAMSKVHGHLQYIDPQCYIDMEFVRNRKSDVYSVGVVFWELSSGRIPFSLITGTQAISRIINGVREKPINGTPQEFIDLYTKCWDQEPENRSEIREVYKALEKIKWDTGITMTKAASSDDESKDEQTTSTTTSANLYEVEVVRPEGILEEAMLVLTRFFNAGRENDDIRGYIMDLLRENSQEPKDIYNMLVNESGNFTNVEEYQHALLLAFCYNRGIGVDQNHGKAFDIFQKLAEKDDNPYGQYFLGECYRSGLGTDLDREKAFKFFGESAKKGASKGQFELAVCYRYGWGVAENVGKAKEWYQKAANKKHLMARRALSDESWQT